MVDDGYRTISSSLADDGGCYFLCLGTSRSGPFAAEDLARLSREPARGPGRRVTRSGHLGHPDTQVVAGSSRRR